VEYCGAHLALYVVSSDGQPCVGELGRPLLVAGDELGYAVHKAAASVDSRLGEVARCLGAAHRQEVHQHVGVDLLEHLGHVHGLLLPAHRHSAAQVLAYAVQHRRLEHLHAQLRHVAELDCAVGLCEDGLAEVPAHLLRIHVEGGHELNVADVVAAEVHVH